MAMVNNFANAKDSRWLQLEVCREYQRNKCTRSDTECKFAHPPATVEVQNGRVIACYDSIKGRCNREKPPCKYFHPPPHLKDQLLINGRNHLALKNALMQQVPLQPVLAGQIPAVVSGNAPGGNGAGPGPGAVTGARGGPRVSPNYSHLHAGLVYSHLFQQQQQHQQAQQRAMAAFFVNGHHANQAALANAAAAAAASNNHANAFQAAFSASLSPPLANKMGSYQATTNPYLTSLPAMGTATSFPYLTHSPMMAAAAAAGLMPADAAAMAAAQLSVVPAATLVTPQKIPRTDRLEVCREFQRGNCKRAETECRFAHPPEHLAVDSAEGVVTVCMDFVKGRCSRDPCRYFHPPPHLQAQLKAAQSRANAAAMPHGVESLVGKKRLRDPADDLILAFPGMSPYTKRPALDKSGVPVYQPGTAAYQQALAMQVQQPFVPVSFAGHPASLQRF